MVEPAPTDVRRTLHSDAFIEGWAHCFEELALEQGFRDGDPRVAVSVSVSVSQDGLRRVTLFTCAIGLHTGAMPLSDAAARFTEDVSLAGPAALHEAERGLFDPSYGRYTWGKFAVPDLREQARARWGSDFSLRRFHSALSPSVPRPWGCCTRHWNADDLTRRLRPRLPGRPGVRLKPACDRWEGYVLCVNQGFGGGPRRGLVGLGNEEGPGR